MSEKPRAYKKDDVVRIVRCDPGAMIGPYLGSEGVVVDASEDKPGLYMVELDIGRAQPDRGGQMGPRFIVREDMIEPDVTEAMLKAAAKVAGIWDDKQDIGTGSIESEVGLFRDIYRAMRAARRG